MPLTLDQAVVSTWAQMLPSVAGMLDKAEAWCRDNGIAPSEILETRLAPDMWDFAMQVQQISHHSAGAIAGVRSGSFSPLVDAPALDFTGLKGVVDKALAAVHSVQPGELDAMIGGETQFVWPGFNMTFATEDFLLSFSLPNFYFHVTTAYALLRMKGVPLGKMDFLGAVRIKT